MSFKVEVKTFGESTYATNAIVLETEDEAKVYGRDLAGRWMMVEEWRVITSEDAPNYKIEEGRMVAIK